MSTCRSCGAIIEWVELESGKMTEKIIANDTAVWVLVEHICGLGQPGFLKVLSVHMTRLEAEAEEYHLEMQATHGITDVRPAFVRILEEPVK